MLLTTTLFLLHALLISYHPCFLPKCLLAFDTHFMRVKFPTNIPSSMFSAKKVYMHLTPKRCVLHALLISYHQCLLWKNYMHLTRTLCVLDALLISYHLCFLPKFYMNLKHTLCVLHALLISHHLCFFEKGYMNIDTHCLRATCPTNILSSKISAKTFTCIWHPHYACYVPYKYPIIYVSAKRFTWFWPQHYACFMFY
jgi:hypothetical protein